MRLYCCCRTSDVGLEVGMDLHSPERETAGIRGIIVCGAAQAQCWRLVTRQTKHCRDQSVLSRANRLSVESLCFGYSRLARRGAF